LANIVNRATARLVRSANTPIGAEAENWIINPDLSLLDGIVPPRYWKVVGDTVVEMSAEEKTAADAALLAARIARLPLSSEVRSSNGLGWTVTVDDNGVPTATPVE
jgi:hypothetical protein